MRKLLFTLLLATGCGLNAVIFHVKDWNLVHEEGYSYHISIFDKNDEGLTIPLQKKETLNIEYSLPNIKEISLVRMHSQPRAKSKAAMDVIAEGVFFNPKPAGKSWLKPHASICTSTNLTINTLRPNFLYLMICE